MEKGNKPHLRLVKKPGKIAPSETKKPLLDEDDPQREWEKQHGEDPDNWPLPYGQPMPWKEWAQELRVEVNRSCLNPAHFADMVWWASYWIDGKSPKQTAQELEYTEAACIHIEDMEPVKGRVCEHCGGPLYDLWDDGPPLEERTWFLGLHCPNRRCPGKKPLALLPIPDGDTPF